VFYMGMKLGPTQ